MTSQGIQLVTGIYYNVQGNPIIGRTLVDDIYEKKTGQALRSIKNSDTTGRFKMVANVDAIRVDFKRVPFYIENISANTGTVEIKKNEAGYRDIEVYTSTDGYHWDLLGLTTGAVGTVLSKSIGSGQRLYIQCDSLGAIRCQFHCDVTYNVGGNLASINRTGFVSYSCYKLFYNESALNDASLLIFPDRIDEAISICESMFEGCDKLINGPIELPAQTLVPACYMNMFKGCIILEISPILHGKILVDRCYIQMFLDCARLNTVRCYADDPGSDVYRRDWLLNVAERGTFIRTPGINWPTGPSGVPAAWTLTP